MKIWFEAMDFLLSGVEIIAVKIEDIGSKVKSGFVSWIKFIKRIFDVLCTARAVKSLNIEGIFFAHYFALVIKIWAGLWHRFLNTYRGYWYKF